MTQSNAKRETFSGRKAFIMAAIGSAVGFGKNDRLRNLRKAMEYQRLKVQ